MNCIILAALTALCTAQPERHSDAICSLLTTVIVTSPPASAPSVGLFTSTYDYLQELPCISRGRFLVGLHISPDRKEEKVWQYEKNIHEWHNRHKSTPLVVSTVRSVEVSFLRLLSLVETKYYLFWEHDWRLCANISLPAILAQMEVSEPAINYVRFNKGQNIVGTGVYDAVLEVCQHCHFVPLLFTPSWSNNPHIARYQFFLDHCRPRLEKDADAPTTQGFFEWPLTLAVTATLWKEGAQNATIKWGTYLYGRLGAPAAIYHLDGANSHATSNFTHVCTALVPQ